MNSSARFTAIVFLTAIMVQFSFWARATLTFEERVKAQEAIERVYYAHRIWPKENPQPKPPFEEMVSREVIEAKVTDTLKKCVALDKYWQMPIRPEQLQAEMDRMARGTQDPDALSELFAALNDDPYRIAECLARPVLAERLLQNWFAYDTRFHAEAKKQAEKTQQEITPETFDNFPLGECNSVSYRLKGQDESRNEKGREGEKGILALDSEQFERIRRELPENGKLSLKEKPEGFVLTLPVLVPEGEITTRTRFFPKTSLYQWWAEEAQRLDLGDFQDFGSSDIPFQLSLLQAACGDQWLGGTLAWPGVPEVRYGHAAVWTGTEMIVWGGWGNGTSLNNGGRYSPSTDSWTTMSTGANCPTGRYLHSMVWTGTEVVVWGGADRENMTDKYTNTGGRYNPNTDSWMATSQSSNCPGARSGYSVVWTGTEMIVWGGHCQFYPPTYPEDFNTGGRYTPSTDTWIPTSTGNDCPSGRENHTAVWTGTEMLVWGGGADSDRINTGGRYDPLTDSWVPTSTGANCPEARYLHTAIWSGSVMIVWGGANSTYLNTGGRYNPTTDAWTVTSTGANCPPVLIYHSAVWTGTEMIVWGGVETNSGGRYNPSTDTWIPTSTGANCPEGRWDHTAIWTGTEMIVWGGGNYSSATVNTGGRYNPTADTWVPTSTGVTFPEGRYNHTSVWTGVEMIVWGGESNVYLNSGGRYNPSTDNWTATSKGSNCPPGKTSATAVWTGTEMVVWGGYSGDGYLNTGGRFNVTLNTWGATSTGANCPSVRRNHAAVWTGTEMIVWGGMYYGVLNTGGRYSPTTDTWTPTSSGNNCPSGRYNHAAIWTGTEMIVWGGALENSGASQTNTGGRYKPATDTWTITSTKAGCPSARESHTAIWTGTEMVAWGGNGPTGPGSYGDLNSGGRYNPSMDSWMPTSMGVNCPESRWTHTAIWTGTEMFVWGGIKYGGGWFGLNWLNTGGRYNPSTDTWKATSKGTNCPVGRSRQTAVWTGSRMLVWGGFNEDHYLGDGGGYALFPTSITLTAAASPSSGTFPLTVTFTASATPSDCTGTPAFAWIFGDGGTSAQQNPSHLYNAAGSFIWTVVATINGVSASKTGTITVNPPCSVSCTASASPTSGEAPLQVSFSASATPSNCAGSVTYSWAFGDGQTSTQRNTFHNYPNAGNYIWTMTASAQGVSCTRTGTITVTEPCTLTCTATAPITGTVGETVAFQSTATPSSCTGSPSFAWAFGDGGTSAEQNACYTYISAGTYAWTLTATVDGKTCSQNGTITVSEPCIVTCAATAPTSGRAGDPIAFTAAAEGTHCSGSPVYAWTFGDGGTSSEQNPVHTYATAGSFTWILTVVADDQTCTQTGTIDVSAACAVTCTASATPSTGIAPLAVAFTGSATATNCNGDPAYAWVFGDGATSSEQNPNHTYTSSGSFEWALMVTMEGKTCSQTGTVTVSAPCVLACEASATPTSGKAPLTVSFMGSATASNCDGDLAYMWVFGDGAVSTEQTPSHICASVGNFTWVLTVTVGGSTCTRAGVVTVEPGLPGDGNGDGVVSIGEVQQAINMFLEILAVGNGVDCNGDGAVSIGEVQKVINGFLGLPTSC